MDTSVDFEPGFPLSEAGFEVECFDSSLDLSDPDGIAGDCNVIASMMERPLPDEIALVVLCRPGPAEISEADEYIFRVLCQAVAGRQTAPWWFYVTGPDGGRRVR